MKETDLFHSAVKYWWDVKTKAAKAAPKQGGTRDQNLTGKNLDGFITTIFEFLVKLGVAERDIYVGGHFSKTAAILPSYFRPSKNWDIVVVSHSRFCGAKGNPASVPRLHAAVEFKSQDKSIGNNQNNRMEESIGNPATFGTVTKISCSRD
jgi:hypothetical protein